MKIMSQKNEILEANKQQGIGIPTVKKRNIEQATLKSTLLKQQTIKKFINREYTHISEMLGNSNN